jgi:hypothetical protein
MHGLDLSDRLVGMLIYCFYLYFRLSVSQRTFERSGKAQFGHFLSVSQKCFSLDNRLQLSYLLIRLCTITQSIN